MRGGKTKWYLPGDRVEMLIASGPRRGQTRTGIVVAHVPAYVHPEELVPGGLNFNGMPPKKVRDHDSWLVRIDGMPPSMCISWPPVDAIRRAK